MDQKVHGHLPTIYTSLQPSTAGGGLRIVSNVRVISCACVPLFTRNRWSFESRIQPGNLPKEAIKLGVLACFCNKANFRMRCSARKKIKWRSSTTGSYIIQDQFSRNWKELTKRHAGVDETLRKSRPNATRESTKRHQKTLEMVPEGQIVQSTTADWHNR